VENLDLQLRFRVSYVALKSATAPAYSENWDRVTDNEALILQTGWGLNSTKFICLVGSRELCLSLYNFVLVDRRPLIISKMPRIMIKGGVWRNTEASILQK
jgi:hypothetical protein